MTDDIVTRLREQAVCSQYECGDCDWHRYAADEIERLRKDRMELLQIAKLFADYGMCEMADELGCVHSDGVCEWHSAEHLWESFCMSRGL